MEETKQILKKFLPPHEITYCDVEENKILGLHFKSAGVAVKLESGLEVFGASSSHTEDPLIYAAYECLERYVIQTLPKETTHQSETFKWSISNGIAIHKTHQEASENAYYELLERNEILKSWFYNTPIKKLSCDLSEFSPEIRDLYQVIVVDFSTIPGKHVIGVFALPNMKELNLVYGFGSAADLDLAIKKAKKEFVTRFGFLWGESASLEEMSINTPDYHQEYYLRKENLDIIREWLFGLHHEKQNFSGLKLRDTEYVNITPDAWKSDFQVIKAVSKDSIPLFFGLPHKHIFDFPFRYDIPHPIV